MYHKMTHGTGPEKDLEAMAVSRKIEEICQHLQCYGRLTTVLGHIHYKALT